MSDEKDVDSAIKKSLTGSGRRYRNEHEPSHAIRKAAPFAKPRENMRSLEKARDDIDQSCCLTYYA